jgi:hypothetical protein
LLDLEVAQALRRILEPAWGVAKLDQLVMLDRDGHLEARLFPVPGKVPAWASALASNHPEATAALRITDKRSGQRLVHAPGVAKLGAGTLAELSCRKLYIHMNNTNPVLDAGSEAAALVRRAGIAIAMDGVELAV